jgi:hypothetical protein
MFSISRLRSILYSLTAVSALVFSTAALSADHSEAPGTNADPDADLADVFIFLAPDKPHRTVGVITWKGRAAPRARIDAFNCDPNVLFTYNLDVANAEGVFDNIPNFQVLARLGTDPLGNCAVQFEGVPGAGRTYVAPFGQVSEATFGGMRGFVGLMNDSFFFDVEAYKALLATFATAGQNGNLIGTFKLTNPPTARHDSFAFRNVSVMMFEMDNNILAPANARGVRPKVRAWATTGRLAK